MEKTKHFISEVFENILKLKASSQPSRPMKYPYTLSAKIAQFPLKFHMQNSWIWRYYPLGVLFSLPFFAFISKLGKHLLLVNVQDLVSSFVVNSPENKKKWEKIRRQEREEQKFS